MGLFKKRQDPITERARDLNDQIAALQAEIQKLSEVQPTPSEPASAFQPQPPAPPNLPQPRLRSTARPRGPFVPSSEPACPEANEEPIKVASERDAPRPEQDLGVRRDDFASAWHRIRTHFPGPVTSNPKLVNYLAAGSIQGLRPLRYEKRVARNRFIVLAVFLVFALWGMIWIIVSRR